VHSVHDAVLQFIASGQGDFDTLALSVFAHQFDSVLPYQRHSRRRGFTPATVRSWRQIPPVPVLAFKETELHCGSPERVFLTTGTSRGAQRRGRHMLPDLRLYRASALTGLRRLLFPDHERMRIVSLIPAVSEAPDSSLAQMVAWAVEELGDADSVYAAAGVGIDYRACVEALRLSEREGRPLCLMTTTAALVHLLDHCRGHRLTFRLPHGSRLMDTGGSKGAPRALSRRGLLQACWNTFALPGYFCVNEYGMAELSSQFYDNVVHNRVTGHFAPRHLIGSPWTRVRVLDPATLEDVREGEEGLLCLYDLANAGTAMAVLTEDVGCLVGEGFEIRGRVRGAESRGCSLGAEEWQRAS